MRGESAVDKKSVNLKEQMEKFTNRDKFFRANSAME